MTVTYVRVTLPTAVVCARQYMAGESNTRMLAPERNDTYRGSCLCEEICRWGTEVSVKITCDVEELF